MRTIMQPRIAIETNDVTPALLVDERHRVFHHDLPLAMESLFSTCFFEAGNQTTGLPVGDPIHFALQGEAGANLLSVCFLRFEEVSRVCWGRLAEVQAETKAAVLAPHLARIKGRMPELIQKARRYRNAHGSPADNLSKLLGGGLTAEEWQDILDEPYG